MAHIRKQSKTKYRGIATAAAATMLLLVSACSSNSSKSPGSTAGSSSAEPGTAAYARALLPASIVKSGVLNLGTNAVLAPLEYVENGKIVGIDPDLWNAVGRILGLTVNATSISFDGLIPAVLSGRFDVAMAGVSDKTVREDQVTFIDTYLAGSGLVVPKDNPKHITEDPLTLCGLTGGSAAGDSGVSYIQDDFSGNCTKSGKPAVNLDLLPSVAQALIALQSGRIDFTLTNLISADYQAAKLNATLIKSPLLPLHYDGMIVQKDALQLQNALLAAMQVMVKNGEYKQILDKWKVPQIAIAAPGINLTKTGPSPAPLPGT